MFDLHTRFSSAFNRRTTLFALLVLKGSLLAGCQSGAGGNGLEERGDPAFAHTCRQAAKQRSANDPIYPRLNALRKARGASPLFYDRDLSKAAHCARRRTGAGRPARS